ncbi:MULTISPECIES: hypothetical protein [Enterobacteriaceae]|uniref:Transcriptional regulator n=1 Tax=Pseudocitrobacter corydidari TaxID=2891570 RepID=A0ABY3SAJ9_9ENTR|nr:hypothetical protein [Pseudocitrobacter corydidari]UGS43812.1 hypothetical protein G163CM_45950 [Pseudocitrobacter corydidari]HCL8467676.1 hypothetical protein [Escherichia coli]
MNVVETLRDLSEVWKLFSEIPDDATLSVDLAALYLGISVKSLARYRQKGGGPQYIQYQSEDSKARNQRINYLLGDLRNWRETHKVKDTIHAAQVRGLTFASLGDFTEPQPFWLLHNVNDSHNKILSHALTTPDADFKALLLKKNATVVWFSVEEALFMNWVSVYERLKWNNLLNEVLKHIIKSSNVAQEKHLLNAYLNSIDM